MNDGFEQIVFYQVAAYVAFAAARIASKQRRAVVYRGNAGAARIGTRFFHLAHHFHLKKQLPIAAAGRGGGAFFFAPIIGQRYHEARVYDVAILLDVLLLAAPAFAVGRIGKHEIEGFSAERVRAEGTAVFDVFGVITLNYHVTFTNGISLVVDLLAIEVHGFVTRHALVLVQYEVLRLGQHPATATGWVINRDNGRQVIAHGIEHQSCHQFDHFTGRKVLPGFLVVFFVKLPDQFLEYVAHTEIGQRG